MDLKRIAITDPMGVWEYSQMIGATVHIKSLAVGRGFFAFDDTANYIIEDIKVRISNYGKCESSIYLKGISKPFAWKDLEVTGVDLSLYPPAICHKFCCGETLCGYGLDIPTEKTEVATSSNTGKNICTCGDGPELE